MISENKRIYGITQNTDTKDYIIVYCNGYCGKCGEEYTLHKWCKPCLINQFKSNLTNWSSNNEKIDNFIQEKQLTINDCDDTLIEWIPYNQFIDVEKTGKNDKISVIIYSAIWSNGLLRYYGTRKPNINVILKCFSDSQNIVEEFLNEV